MNTEQIEAFLAVVRYGNISRAAEKTFVSQPTLSHRIAELENELNAQLFIRSKGQRQIQLTEQGHAFFCLSEDWKNLLDATKRLNQIQKREHLRISITHTIAESFFIDVLRLFSARALPIYLHVSSSSSNDSLRKIQNDEADFAIAGNTISWMHVVTEALARERIVFVSGVDSPYGDIVKVNELNPNDELYINWGNDQLLWHQYHFGADYIPHMRIENAFVAEAFFSSQRPNMWMPMAYSAATAMLKNGNVKISELDDPIPSREINLISRIPVKQFYHDLLRQDILTVLKSRNEFSILSD
ncbi:MAG: LysR family transcriptional regulator [Eubacteriales bacterium]|nr:LysR family transcriptional regulator [Eubacteriales bacterium]